MKECRQQLELKGEYTHLSRNWRTVEEYTRHGPPHSFFSLRGQRFANISDLFIELMFEYKEVELWIGLIKRFR